MNDYIYMDFVTYKVYVKTYAADGTIIAVNSSAFLTSLTGWVEIDEGAGDRYHHAQGNYFGKPLTDENGLYNYKLVDGKPVERTAEDKQPELDRLNAQAEIAECKRNLAATDYVAAKLAEGVATKEEYAETLALRAEWRARINELEV